MNAFATYCSMEGIKADFFVIRNQKDQTLLRRSIKKMIIFEGFSTYIVEGRGCTVKTAQQYGRAVRRTISDCSGYDCKYGFQWSRLERTHKGLLVKYPYKKRRRDAVLIQDLRELSGLINLSNHTWAMYWAMTMVTFFGVSRKGDHVPDSAGKFSIKHHTTVGDIRFDGSELYLKMDEHKTSRMNDKFNHKPYVSAEEGNPLCPVRAIRNYMRVAGVIDGNDVLQVPSSTPLFRFVNGKIMTGRHYLKFVKVAMRHVGKDPRWYGTHSMRIGGATLAMMCPSGNKETVRMVGFWTSSAMDTYIFPTKEVMRVLGKEMLATKNTILAE